MKSTKSKSNILNNKTAATSQNIEMENVRKQSIKSASTFSMASNNSTSNTSAPLQFNPNVPSSSFVNNSTNTTNKLTANASTKTLLVNTNSISNSNSVGTPVTLPMLQILNSEGEQKQQQSQQQDSEELFRVAMEELKEMNKSFVNNQMNAFGQRESTLLKQIDSISQLQVRSFLSSMEIELKYPNVISNFSANSPTVDDKQYTDFETDQFSKVLKAFQEKEKAITKLVQDLNYISKSVDSMNANFSSGPTTHTPSTENE